MATFTASLFSGSQPLAPVDARFHCGLNLSLCLSVSRFAPPRSSFIALHQDKLFLLSFEWGAEVPIPAACTR